MLSIASVIIGVLLIYFTDQFHGFADPDIGGIVAVITALLVVGVIWGLRPRSKS